MCPHAIIRGQFFQLVQVKIISADVAVDAQQAGGRVLRVVTFFFAIVAVAESVPVARFLRLHQLTVFIENEVVVIISPYRRGEAIVQVIGDMYRARALFCCTSKELFQGAGQVYRCTWGGGNREGVVVVVYGPFRGCKGWCYPYL